MRLGTRILLLTLATTVGLSGVVLWIVTQTVTENETKRARSGIRESLRGYDEYLDARHAIIAQLIRQLMVEPVRRAQIDNLESDDEKARQYALAQVRDTFFKGDVVTELGESNAPAFQLLFNERGQMLVAQSEGLESALRSAQVDWRIGDIIAAGKTPRVYAWVGNRLFLAFGVPLRLAPNEPPTQAYLAGYTIDDAWLGHALHLARSEEGLVLEACVLVDGSVIAQGSSEGGPLGAGAAEAVVRASPGLEKQPASIDAEFVIAGNRHLGRISSFVPAASHVGRFAVMSSLDAALAGLRHMQRLIAMATAIVVCCAVLICRQLARSIARPVESLVDASGRIAKGEFGVPLDMARRDELGELAGSFKRMAAGLEQRDLIKDTFGKFVDPTLVEQFLAEPERLRLGGERRVQSILFSDLANFTALSEKLPPEELVKLLNGYLGAAADVVTELHGIVDKFIGDAVVAFWGPPLAERHAELACRAALRLARQGEELSRAAAALGCPRVYVRIGVGTGEVLVGNIGSRSKYNYTVIGDVANLASRLEGINKLYGTQILVTRETVRAAGPGLLTRRIDMVRVLGRGEPVEVYELMGEAGEGSKAAAELCAAYAGAMQIYEARQWLQARTAFERIAQRWSGDGPARVMAQRCAEFIERDPGSAWDGVWQLESKGG